MNYDIFLKKFGYGNSFGNLTINDRYHKRSVTLTKDSKKININNNHSINKTILGKNSTLKSKSISEVIKKIENLKNKYNKINFQKQINSKIVYKKILNLKNKYFKENKKVVNTENNINNYINNNFKIQSTDKISMINKSWNKKHGLNLILQTSNQSNNIDQILNTPLNDKKIKLEKSNEINYQINSKSQINRLKNSNCLLNINLYKSCTENNNKNIRDEFLNLDKRINLLLKDDNINDSDDESLYSNRRMRSVQSIKDRIILLTDVKNKIKKINKDAYEENEKTQNSEFSIDSQITLGFKHIKPVIKKENFFEDYLKDDEPKIDNETILKPTLIRSLPRPKLNVPNYPSFFRK